MADPAGGPALLSGRRYLLTYAADSASGLGLARLLLHRGADVIITGATQESAKAAAALLNQEASSSTAAMGTVEGLALDPYNLESARRFVADFKQRKLPLHAIVHGAIEEAGSKSHLPVDFPSGADRALTANHLSAFLLTQLLLPLLIKSGAARIVLSSDASHASGDCARLRALFANGEVRRAHTPSMAEAVGMAATGAGIGAVWHSLTSEDARRSLQAAADAKLGCLLHAVELHRRLSKHKLTPRKVRVVAVLQPEALLDALTLELPEHLLLYAPSAAASAAGAASGGAAQTDSSGLVHASGLEHASAAARDAALAAEAWTATMEVCAQPRPLSPEEQALTDAEAAEVARVKAEAAAAAAAEAATKAALPPTPRTLTRERLLLRAEEDKKKRAREAKEAKKGGSKRGKTTEKGTTGGKNGAAAAAALAAAVPAAAAPATRRSAKPVGMAANTKAQVKLGCEGPPPGVVPSDGGQFWVDPLECLSRLPDNPFVQLTPPKDVPPPVELPPPSPPKPFSPLASMADTDASDAAYYAATAAAAKAAAAMAVGGNGLGGFVKLGDFGSVARAAVAIQGSAPAPPAPSPPLDDDDETDVGVAEDVDESGSEAQSPEQLRAKLRSAIRDVGDATRTAGRGVSFSADDVEATSAEEAGSLLTDSDRAPSDLAPSELASDLRRATKAMKGFQSSRAEEERRNASMRVLAHAQARALRRQLQAIVKADHDRAVVYAMNAAKSVHERKRFDAYMIVRVAPLLGRRCFVPVEVVNVPVTAQAELLKGPLGGKSMEGVVLKSAGGGRRGWLSREDKEELGLVHRDLTPYLAQGALDEKNGWLPPAPLPDLVQQANDAGAPSDETPAPPPNRALAPYWASVACAQPPLVRSGCGLKTGEVGRLALGSRVHVLETIDTDEGMRRARVALEGTPDVDYGWMTVLTKDGSANLRVLRKSEWPVSANPAADAADGGGGGAPTEQFAGPTLRQQTLEGDAKLLGVARVSEQLKALYGQAGGLPAAEPTPKAIPKGTPNGKTSTSKAAAPGKLKVASTPTIKAAGKKSGGTPVLVKPPKTTPIGSSRAAKLLGAVATDSKLVAINKELVASDEPKASAPASPLPPTAPPLPPSAPPLPSAATPTFMAEALATSWSASVSAAASAPLDEAGVVKKAKMAAATPTEEVSATKKGKKASAGTGSKAAKPPKAKKELFEASSATGNASDAVVNLFDALGANGPHDVGASATPKKSAGPGRSADAASPSLTKSKAAKAKAVATAPNALATPAVPATPATPVVTTNTPGSGRLAKLSLGSSLDGPLAIRTEGSLSTHTTETTPSPNDMSSAVNEKKKPAAAAGAGAGTKKPIATSPTVSVSAAATRAKADQARALEIKADQAWAVEAKAAKVPIASSVDALMAQLMAQAAAEIRGQQSPVFS
ncbi:hypothetical protein Ctob_008787 [Chrysochromulina tobinii]|uniref:Short-chain dehydrogenase reductase sdr n=1 Tax=Chrysochromulina tobinii TaxID=1460289 RepID=A0A0M0K5L6_9EUKA|nr:hypothetical protein Ctob_008787 [Chrysochromulina tobinii]|eukprot:KOO34110.1 hypothetical protein Ctob_008787 [Chrysochromulina sp. CCMP291]